MHRRKLKIAEFDEKIFIGDGMKIERLEKLRDEKESKEIKIDNLKDTISKLIKNKKNV